MKAKHFRLGVAALGCAALWNAASANAQPPKRPNIPVIFGDDIGWFNLSAYNMGMMGYRTPNIDRIAHEAMLFTSIRAHLAGLRALPAVADRHVFLLVPAPGIRGEIPLDVQGVPATFQTRQFQPGQDRGADGKRDQRLGGGGYRGN